MSHALACRAQAVYSRERGSAQEEEGGHSAYEAYALGGAREYAAYEACASERRVDG